MRRKHNKSTGRNYSYDKAYAARPSQKKRRAQRNKARRKAIASGKVKKGSKMDVHHVGASKKGSLNRYKTKVISRTKNRGLK